jgi:hypothetical protein
LIAISGGEPLLLDAKNVYNNDLHRESWSIFYQDVRVGTIGWRAGVAVEVDQWGWSLSFYPGLEPGQRGYQARRRRRDVAYWPVSEVATSLVEVGLSGHRGLDLHTPSSSRFCPKQACLNRRVFLVL